MKANKLLRLIVISCVLAAVIAAAAMARNGTTQRSLPSNDQEANVIIWFTMQLDGAEVPGFFKQFTIESGVDPSKLSLAAGKALTLPREHTPPTLTLVRSIDQNLTLSEWHEAALSGDPSAPADVDITGLDYMGRAVATWHLEKAWPSKYESGGLGVNVSTETFTIVAEKIERVG